jgi:hypothetical protein
VLGTTPSASQLSNPPIAYTYPFKLTQACAYLLLNICLFLVNLDGFCTDDSYAVLTASPVDIRQPPLRRILPAKVHAALEYLREPLKLELLSYLMISHLRFSMSNLSSSS